MYMCEFFETCMLLDKLRSSKFGVLLDLFSFSFAYLYIERELFFIQ